MENKQKQEGRYIYCIVNYNGQEFSAAGIEGNEAYIIQHEGIAAIVHNCPAKPYESKDEIEVKKWILIHHNIIEQARKKFNSVIPFTFDTIIKGKEENVKEWLRKESKKFREILEKFKGKSEYTVQIFLDTEEIKKSIEKSDSDISQMEEQIKSKPKGTAFMLKKKLEAMMHEKISIEAGKYAKKSQDMISNIPDEVKQEKLKKNEEKAFKDKEMILNLSCLVDDSKVESLSKVLEKISGMHNARVRFTGPWAPYSFVNLKGD